MRNNRQCSPEGTSCHNWRTAIIRRYRILPSQFACICFFFTIFSFQTCFHTEAQGGHWPVLFFFYTFWILFFAVSFLFFVFLFLLDVLNFVFHFFVFVFLYTFGILLFTFLFLFFFYTLWISICFSLFRAKNKTKTKTETRTSKTKTKTNWVDHHALL